MQQSVCDCGKRGSGCQGQCNGGCNGKASREAYAKTMEEEVVEARKEEEGQFNAKRMAVEVARAVMETKSRQW